MKALFLATFCILYSASCILAAKPPNIILIVADNLGYGDIGPFGSKINRTPNLDRMAAEGMKLTSFYVGSSICTPSRAAFMTGCYPARVSMEISGTRRGVLQPVAQKGLAPGEITVAEILKEQNYATHCIGKWHLGDQPPFLPTRQGFDHWLGVPYSEDMIATTGPRLGEMWPPMPLVRDETVIDAPVDPDTLTQRYTKDAVRFIRANKEKPFFLYVPHAVPGSSVEAFASDEFRARSQSGAYGACVEELDWSLGEMLEALQEEDLDNNTLVLWTSDNGAFQGNRRVKPMGVNLPLRGTGGSADEGGFRVPCIVRWPGKIPAGSVSNELTTSMDLLPTFASLAGSTPPNDRTIDGKDIWPLLTETEKQSPTEHFFYYRRTQLAAVRQGRWKLHLPINTNAYRPGIKPRFHKLELFDLEADIEETTNLAAAHPGIVARLTALASKGRSELGDIGLLGSEQRPAGWLDDVRALRLPGLPSERGFPSDAVPLIAPGAGMTWWKPESAEGGWAAAASAALDVENPKQLAISTTPGDAILHNTAVDPAGKSAPFLFSASEFGDIEGHLEFQLAAKSNSGLYLMSRYEIQILDNHGKPGSELTPGDTGGIYYRWDPKRDPGDYEGTAPPVNASRPAGEWQSLDFLFRAPRFDKAGKKIANARFDYINLNGVRLHTNLSLNGPTGGAVSDGEVPRAPLAIQGDHGPVALRNLWIRDPR